MVHEYGGGAYAVHRGTVFFSNFDGPAAVPAGRPARATGRRSRRRRAAPIGSPTGGSRPTAAGGSACASATRRARSPRPNELVVIPTDGSAEPGRSRRGRDFYSVPAHLARRPTLCLLAWDLPWMPWDGTELFVATSPPTGRSARPGWWPARRRGVDLPAGVEPRRRPVFVARPDGLVEPRPRARRRTATVQPDAEAEFGCPQWVFGCSSYAFLADGRIACQYAAAGSSTRRCSTPRRASCRPRPAVHRAIAAPSLVAEGADRVHRRGAATAPTRWCCSTSPRARSRSCARATSVDGRRAYLSMPEPIEFPTDGRADRVRALLPADEPRSPRPRRASGRR